jgi:hypothetical protein
MTKAKTFIARRCNRRGFIQLSVALTEIQLDEIDPEFTEAIQ